MRPLGDAGLANSMSTPTIRPVVAQDFAMIAAIHAASWRSAYRGILRDQFLDKDIDTNRAALWRERLSNKPANHFGYIAVVDDRVVGFGYAFGAEDDRWGTLVDNLHVLPECKGAGLGRRLLGAIAEEASERYADAGIHLWVFEKNHPARTFYERLGAKSVERVEIVPPGGGVAAEFRYVWERSSDLAANCRSTMRESNHVD